MVPPEITSIMTLTVMAPALRSAKPRNSRNPTSPKITPLAPMTTVFGAPKGHAPRPLLTAVIKIRPRNRPSVTATYATHAQHREHDRVRDQVLEAGVQERREQDAPRPDRRGAGCRRRRAGLGSSCRPASSPQRTARVTADDGQGAGQPGGPALLVWLGSGGHGPKCQVDGCATGRPRRRDRDRESRFGEWTTDPFSQRTHRWQDWDLETLLRTEAGVWPEDEPGASGA